MSSQKKLNNSFLTHLHYYIIISKLLNIINATIYYYYFINQHKSVEYCLEKWETVKVEGENQLKKVGNMKSGEHEKWGKFKYKWGTKNNTPLFNQISRLKHRNLMFRPY